MSSEPLIHRRRALPYLVDIRNALRENKRVTYSITGRAYIVLSNDHWVDLPQFIYSISDILYKYPHFNEKEREAGDELGKQLKGLVEQARHKKEETGFCARMISCCCCSDIDCDALNSYIDEEIIRIVNTYTRRQWKKMFPKNPLPACDNPGYDEEPRYIPPVLFREYKE